MNKLLSLTIPGSDGSVEIEAPANIPTGGLSTDGNNIISLGVSLFLFGAVLFAAGFIVYGGFRWITSNGDKGKVEEARKIIIYSIIGLLICLLAFAGVGLLSSALGVDLLKTSL